jgi:hypothetical protein
MSLYVINNCICIDNVKINEKSLKDMKNLGYAKKEGCFIFILKKNNFTFLLRNRKWRQGQGK